jgi:hypothetical protein
MQLHTMLEQFRQELTQQLSAREYVELLATCCSLTITFVVRRTNRWLREHSERERQRAEQAKLDDLQRRLDDRQREFYRQKETVRTMFEASQIGSALTLEELLDNTELDFSTRSSGAPSAPSVSSSTTTKRP